jgi:hypothetical protein
VTHITRPVLVRRRRAVTNANRIILRFCVFNKIKPLLLLSLLLFTVQPSIPTLINTIMASEEATEQPKFANTSGNGEIPSFNGDAKAKATDFANYFCSYAQLYHQKQMLADHNRMAAYHAAILGNADVFKDKVVMDVGTGSGILAVWAAQAGARKVYASE